MSLPTTAVVVGKAFVIRDGGDPYAIKQQQQQQQQSTHQHHSMNKVIHTCITDDLLARLAGTTDFSSVTSFEIAVDTSESAVAAAIGDTFPYLGELKLNDSILTSFRDLGTSFRNLKILWAARCGQLTDLDGVCSLLPNLTELYLAFNNIEDIGPLALHESLVVLDLEGNRIADESALVTLGMIPKLRMLTLEGNPISLESGYRDLVAANASQIEYLDDESLEHDDDDADEEDDEDGRRNGNNNNNAGDDDDDDHNDAEEENDNGRNSKPGHRNNNNHKQKDQLNGSTPASDLRVDPTNTMNRLIITGNTNHQYAARAATASSDPLSIADSSDSKLDSPEKSPQNKTMAAMRAYVAAASSPSSFSSSAPTNKNINASSSSSSSSLGSGSGGTVTSPTKSSAFVHEEYTIAQSLRTRGVLGSDAEYLLNGRTSPTFDNAANTNANDEENNAQLRRQRRGSTGRKEAEEDGDDDNNNDNYNSDDDDDDDDDTATTGGNNNNNNNNNSRPVTSSSFGTGSLPNTNSRPGSSATFGRPGTARSSNSFRNIPTPTMSASEMAMINTTTTNRPGTAASAGMRSTSSDLTHGEDAVVLAGGLAGALRRKRTGSSSVPSSPGGGNNSHTNNNILKQERDALVCSSSSNSRSNRNSRHGSESSMTGAANGGGGMVLTSTAGNTAGNTSLIGNGILDITTGSFLSTTNTTIATGADASFRSTTTIHNNTINNAEPGWFVDAQARAGLSRPGTAVGASSQLRRPGTASSATSAPHAEMLTRLGLDTSMVSMDSSESDSDNDNDNDDDGRGDANHNHVRQHRKLGTGGGGGGGNTSAATTITTSATSSSSSSFQRQERSSIMAVLDEARKEDEKTKKRAVDEMRTMRQQLKSASGYTAAAGLAAVAASRPTTSSGERKQDEESDTKRSDDDNDDDKEEKEGRRGRGGGGERRRPVTTTTSTRPHIQVTTSSSSQGGGGGEEDGPPSLTSFSPAPSRIAASSSSSSTNTPRAIQTATNIADLGNLPPGPALIQKDEELVHLLRQKPKNVPQLHSRDSFRRFFSWITKSRMISLLMTAYDDLPTEAERKEKVMKRLELLNGILSDD